MKKLWEKYSHVSLMFRILVGLFIGVSLGLLFPSCSIVAVLGKLFVGALKGIAPILVFTLIISAIVNANSEAISNRFSRVIGLYMMSTLCAAFCAVIFSLLFPTSLPLQLDASTDMSGLTPPQGINEVLLSLISNLVVNPVSSLMNANYIGILFWSIIFGIAFKVTGNIRVANAFKTVSDAVTKVVKWVIDFAPFGVMGLVFDTVSNSGLDIFTSYRRLICILVGCMVFMALVVSPLIVGITLRINPYPLVLKCYRESGLTAFFTRSSAANIPVNMALCERLGLNRSFYSVSLSLGSTINMDGAAITITVMTLATVNTLGIGIDIPTALLLSLMATIGACGTSGVAGGSMLLVPMACALFGIPDAIAMKVVAIGFVIGVIQDSLETCINSSGDVIYCATAEYLDWKKQGKKIIIAK